jgi:ketosteroid isomerase-like protein
MKKLFGLPTTLLLLPLLSVSVVRVGGSGETGAPDELFRTIAALDGSLFDAFNRCDLEKFNSFFVDDLEFYHDQDGLTVGRQNVTEAVKRNICGKVTRELVPGTLQVYPLRGYGAIEIGVHRFHHPKAEDTEPVGEGKFVHVWQNKDGAWKITRVLSYDHRALPK